MSPVEFGTPRRHYRLCDSTNERARLLAAAGAPSGTVVTADEQSAGRGRRQRRWSAPAGSAVLCSAILRPVDQRHALLPLAVPLAVCEAVEALASVSCSVKWPNDVWIEKKKVCGVLIEARPPGWAVMGIGINVSIEPDQFPRGLRWPPTSVGHGVTVERALAAVCERLCAWVEAPAERVLAAYRARDALRGREVAWQGAGDAGSGSGIAEGIDEAGNLLVADPSGSRIALGAGEVGLRLG